MEGISSVVLGDHVQPIEKDHGRFRKLITAEANAAIEGTLDGGVEEIIVNDRHDRMANVLIEELGPAAERQVVGRGWSRVERVPTAWRRAALLRSNRNLWYWPRFQTTATCEGD